MTIPRVRFGQTEIDSTVPTLIVGTLLECVVGLQLKSLRDNTDVIYVGESDVDATNGFPLYPGEGLLIPIQLVDKIYALADVDDEVLAWVVV